MSNEFVKYGYEAPYRPESRTKEGINMFREFKSYLSEHRDIIFTLMLLFLADSYFLNGAIRSKLESILHKTVDGLEKKIGDESAEA